MKRVFDIICSACGLLFLSPGLVLIACMIRAGDRGPVFYHGVRVGLNGRLFRIFKFRTMVVDAEKLGASSTSDDDARITRIGKFLRKHKLDELPQLINVLIGDMSLVGPRPEVKYYTDMYTEEEKAILSVRPGITDWASIWNAHEGVFLAGAEDLLVALQKSRKRRSWLPVIWALGKSIHCRHFFKEQISVLLPEQDVTG